MGRFARSAVVALVVALVIVAMATSCARGNRAGTAGGVGVGAPPAGLPGRSVDDDASEPFADAGAWICHGDTASCGAETTRRVVRIDGTTDDVTVAQPAADCFIVHAADDPHLGAASTPEEAAPLPTARALAPLCRVFAPRLAEQSTTDRGDEVLDAFRYYAANMNDGRPFVVAAESSQSGEMSLGILDEVRTSSQLRPVFVAALLPGVALDTGAQPLTFCTVLEARGCVLSMPVIQVGATRGPAVPGVAAGWAGACTDPADADGRPGLLPAWMVSTDADERRRLRRACAAADEDRWADGCGRSRRPLSLQPGGGRLAGMAQRPSVS